MIPQTTFVLTFRPHIISELGGVIFAGTFGVYDVVFLTKFTVVYDEDAKPARRDFSTII